VPINLTVHSYSNLTLDAALTQEGFAPGDAVHLTASLWEYRAPLTHSASVWADVRQPDGSRATLQFSRASAGDYRADWTTTRPGVYQFVIHAEGHTSGQARFTREKVLTAGVWVGGDRPFDPADGGDGGGTGKDDASCRMILCLIETVMKSPELQERLKALGLDLDDLRRCLDRQLGKGRTTVEGGRAEAATSDEWRTLSRSPEFRRLIASLASSGLAEMKVLEAAKTTPVKRKPKMAGSDENMFVRPDEPTRKSGKEGKRKE
jgi:hypothetical protein